MCHAWSTTPAYDLVTHCVGIQVVEPGASRVTIAPQLMGLDWAEGAIPTIRGVVEAGWSWDETAGDLLIWFVAPRGVQVDIIPPKINGRSPKLSVKVTPKKPKKVGEERFQCHYG